MMLWEDGHTHVGEGSLLLALPHTRGSRTARTV
jgi:hypothetical protein